MQAVAMKLNMMLSRTAYAPPDVKSLQCRLSRLRRCVQQLCMRSPKCNIHSSNQVLPCNAIQPLCIHTACVGPLLCEKLDVSVQVCPSVALRDAHLNEWAEPASVIYKV